MEKEKIQILLDEFKALREEISRRSKDQLSLIQMNITAIGVILGFVISSVKDSRVPTHHTACVVGAGNHLSRQRRSDPAYREVYTTPN
jgi:hypothetical protein